MSDTWFCEKQSSDDFQQEGVGNKPKEKLQRDRNGSIIHEKKDRSENS